VSVPEPVVEISRRRAIEDVASELFRSHGYAATSVRDIARALDLQGPSLYAHVTSKADVLWAIVNRAATSFESAADGIVVDAVRARIADPTGPTGRILPDASTELACLVRAHIRVITDDVGAAAVFVHEWRSLGEDRRREVLARRDAYERRFRSVIADGVATGEFEMTDPAVAATAILSMLNAIPGWYDPAGRLGVDRIADHFVDLSLRMLQGAIR
jgi:AcrR family transcriptional regulator